LWIKLPSGKDAKQLFHSALANNIGIAPGTLFSANGDYADHIRLTCGLPWDEQLEQAMFCLGKLVHEQGIEAS
jgi:DNA-binding transcriptional MocR family regulator